MPDRLIKKSFARERRKKRIKKRIIGSPEKPRMVVNRSLKHIYVQIVDDFSGITLASASSRAKDLVDEISKAKNHTERSKIVGKSIAKTALEKKITRVIFDRGGYLYHGRVKALADGAREGGLQF